MYHDNFYNIQLPFSFCSQYDGWSFESKNYWTSPSLSSFLKYHHIINHNHPTGQYSSDQRDGSGVMYYPGGRFIIIVIRTYIFHNGWNYFFHFQPKRGPVGGWQAEGAGPGPHLTFKTVETFENVNSWKGPGPHLIFETVETFENGNSSKDGKVGFTPQ